MSTVKQFNVGPATRGRYDKIIREAAKPNAVEERLGCRYTSKEGSYGAYERYLLSNGHTLFFSLDTEKASVSKEPDKFAQAKVEKREAKAKKRLERKVKAEAKTVKVVEHDPKIPTVPNQPTRMVKKLKK